MRVFANTAALCRLRFSYFYSSLIGSVFSDGCRETSIFCTQILDQEHRRCHSPCHFCASCGANTVPESVVDSPVEGLEAEYFSCNLAPRHSSNTPGIAMQHEMTTLPSLLHFGDGRFPRVTVELERIGYHLVQAISVMCIKYSQPITVQQLSKPLWSTHVRGFTSRA